MTSGPKVNTKVRGGTGRTLSARAPQPTSIVIDVKADANAKGALALRLDIGTVADFRNLTVTRE
jgi:hypothetical protein